MKVIMLGLSVPCGVNTVQEMLSKELRNYVEVLTVTSWFGENGFYLDDGGKVKKYRSIGDIYDRIRNKVNKDEVVLHVHTHIYLDPGVGGFQEIRRYLGLPPVVSTIHSFQLYELLTSPENEEYRKWFETLQEEKQRNELEKLKQKYQNVREQSMLIENSDKVILLTNTSMSRFIRYYPEHEQKGIVIPNGTDFLGYLDDPNVWIESGEIRKNYAPNGEKIILFVGRLSNEKNPIDVIRAFNYIRTPSTLLIIGDGPEKEIMLRELRPEKRNNVYFLGWIPREELPAYYYAADVCVISSIRDTFPMTALEASALKTPLIVADVDGLHEIFVERKMAFSYPPGKFFGIVWIIDDMFSGTYNHMYASFEEAQRRAKRAYRAVEEEFNITTVAKKHLEVYEEILCPMVMIW